jgi:hypothetical protein
MCFTRCWGGEAANAVDFRPRRPSLSRRSRALADANLTLLAMLSRSTLRAASRAPTLVQVAPNSARGMATLRELELRLKSVRNIEKITKVRDTASATCRKP